MTISFDTPVVSGYQNAESGGQQTFKDDPCGAQLDWLRGIEGLPRPAGRSPSMSESLLTKVIEREIIPRLFLAHRDPLAPSRPNSIDTVAIDDSETFARLVLCHEPAEILDQVQILIDRGVSLQRIYLDLLAPVARQLGKFWEEDRCTFTDVTIGLSRLHQVLREVGRRNGEGFHRSMAKRRIYLVPTPGEQHTFGLSMVEEFFLHAGWETASDHIASAASILQTLSTQWVDVVGFTVGCEEVFDPMVDLINRARKASLNRDMAILVGGRIFTDHPDFVAKISGSAIVSDGVNAVDAAENLLVQTRRPGALQQPT